MDLKALAEPFKPSETEWRVGSCGIYSDRIWCQVLCYVTIRAIMDRLDSVCGPAGWRNEYEEWRGKGVLCGLSILVDGSWITKWDGADETDIESTKGGLSDAMKRAAVQWGIGRYLYNLDAGFLEDRQISADRQSGWKKAKTKEGKVFWWTPPQLPTWALPDATDGEPAAAVPPKDIEKTKKILHDAACSGGRAAMQDCWNKMPEPNRNSIKEFEAKWLLDCQKLADDFDKEAVA